MIMIPRGRGAALMSSRLWISLGTTRMRIGMSQQNKNAFPGQCRNSADDTQSFQHGPADTERSFRLREAVAQELGSPSVQNSFFIEGNEDNEGMMSLTKIFVPCDDLYVCSAEDES
jgi:hypothetical protein